MLPNVVEKEVVVVEQPPFALRRSPVPAKHLMQRRMLPPDTLVLAAEIGTLGSSTGNKLETLARVVQERQLRRIIDGGGSVPRATADRIMLDWVELFAPAEPGFLGQVEREFVDLLEKLLLSSG